MIPDLVAYLFCINLVFFVFSGGAAAVVQVCAGLCRGLIVCGHCCCTRSGQLHEDTFIPPRSREKFSVYFSVDFVVAQEVTDSVQKAARTNNKRPKACRHRKYLDATKNQ